MERRRMCCIHLIRTEYTSRCDHTNRKLALLHLTCLNRWCLGTKQNGIIDKESILLISCRMILRDVQFCKVIVCILNLRTFYNLISHSNEDTFNFFQSDSVRMTMTDLCLLCRKCYIDNLSLHLLLTDFFLKLFPGSFQKLLDFCSCLIDKLTNLRTLLRSDIFHTF